MDLLTIAKKIADRVEAESVKQNVPVAMTVIDIHGNVVLTHRMTGAPAFSLELAERKAYTSALVGLRTADLVPLVQPGEALYPLLAVSGGRYSAIGGGVPVTSDGQVIAGVGVSGGTVGAGCRRHRSSDEIDRGYRAHRQFVDDSDLAGARPASARLLPDLLRQPDPRTARRPTRCKEATTATGRTARPSRR